MITTPTQVTALVEAARARGLVALDTEFVWERTYYPRLGVVQVALSEEEVHLIDAVALDDLAALAPLLEDPATVKILHDAQQDLIILRRASGASPVNIFDTQRAAGLVGLSATISLADLLQALLDVDLPKTQTRTDWVRRPLSDEQIAYAEDDVRHMPEAYQRLTARARTLGRTAWVEEEMRAYDDPALYEEKDPRTQYDRISGTGRLNSTQRAAIRELAAWREEEARAQNRPRGHIVPDNVLVEVARLMPRAATALKRVRGRFERERYGEALVQAVAAGAAVPPEERPERPPSPPPNDEHLNARIDFALAYLKGKSLAQDVDHQLIANRADVTSLVRHAADGDAGPHPLLQGWRRTFMGNDLLQLLDGALAVRVNPATGLPERVNGSASSSA